MNSCKGKRIEENNKSNTYAIIVLNSENYNSYFGLSSSETKLLCTCLDNLNLEYDVYIFTREKRNNEN